MLDIGELGSSEAVADKFLDHGVVTVPGSAFGNESEGFLRVSFCADKPQLTEGVARLKTALAGM
jgi:aspartate aminotransferase